MIKELYQRVYAKLDDARFMRAFHGWATLAWLLAALPICIWLKQSIAFLVFISVYAVVMGHWSSWQAARVEEKQDQQIEEAETIAEGATEKCAGRSSPHAPDPAPAP